MGCAADMPPHGLDDSVELSVIVPMFREAARIGATLGHRDEAVALLHQAIRTGFARVYLLHAEPDLAPLAKFPPFQALLRPRG
jgi:hypothetical protein